MSTQINVKHTCDMFNLCLKVHNYHHETCRSMSIREERRLFSSRYAAPPCTYTCVYVITTHSIIPVCSLTLHYVHSTPVLHVYTVFTASRLCTLRPVLHVCTVFTASTLCTLRPCPTCLYSVHCQYTMYTQPLSYMSVQCSLPVHYVHSDPFIPVCSLRLLRPCHICLFTDTTQTLSYLPVHWHY